MSKVKFPFDLQNLTRNETGSDIGSLTVASNVIEVVNVLLFTIPRPKRAPFIELGIDCIKLYKVAVQARKTKCFYSRTARDKLRPVYFWLRHPFYVPVWSTTKYTTQQYHTSWLYLYFNWVNAESCIVLVFSWIGSAMECAVGLMVLVKDKRGHFFHIKRLRGYWRIKR